MSGPEPAQGAPRPRLRAAWGVCLGASLAFTAVYLLFLPRICGIKDEVGFVNQAVLWREDAGDTAALGPAADLILSHDRLVSWRNPGRSLVLLPLLRFDSIPVLYLSSLLFHLGTVLASALLLVRLRLSPLWSLLVLFHPTLALYSRTLMADEPAAFFLVLAALGLTRRRHPGFWAGLALGAGAVFRYQVGLLLPFLAVGIASWRQGPFGARWSGRLRTAAACLVGGGLAGLPLFVYNQYWYGSPLGYTGQGTFSFSHVPANLQAYVPALALFWPLMILAPADRSRLQVPMRWLILPLFGLMLLYSWHDIGGSTLETLVVAPRLLQPVLPLWIVSYAAALQHRFGSLRDRVEWFDRLDARPRLRRRLGQGLGLLLLAGFLAGQTAMFAKHQRHLEGLESAQSDIAARVPAGSALVGNETVRKLFALLDSGLPSYRWLSYEENGRPIDLFPILDTLPGEWYLAVLPKRPGYEFAPVLQEYLHRFRMTRIPTKAPVLLLYRREPATPTEGAGGPTPPVSPR